MPTQVPFYLANVGPPKFWRAEFTSQAFIARIGDSHGLNWLTGRLFASATDLVYSEDPLIPRDPACRLRAHGQIICQLNASGQWKCTPQLVLSLIGGREIMGIRGRIGFHVPGGGFSHRPDRPYQIENIPPLTHTLTTATWRLVVYGHPHWAFEPGFWFAKGIRRCWDIWHEVHVEVRITDNHDVEFRAFFVMQSAFPSHRLWLVTDERQREGVRVATIHQQALRSLWEPAPPPPMWPNTYVRV